MLEIPIKSKNLFFFKNDIIDIEATIINTIEISKDLILCIVDTKDIDENVIINIGFKYIK